jgi:hypothetical protein
MIRILISTFIKNRDAQNKYHISDNGGMMSPKQKILLSALIAAIIAGGGAFIGVASDLGDEENLSDIRLVTWMVIIIIAVVAAAKDLKTYLAKPPEV